MTSTTTLSVDCGGGGIKASVLDAEGTIVSHAVRTPTPYPLPPERLVETIDGLAEQLPPADRVTVGMPGMIRHGVVVATPHYVTKAGPRSRVLPDLVEAWARFDMGGAVSATLGRPTLVLNDAEVAGAGVVTGHGLEMIVTLGTGLGNAVFDNGVLAPHVEVSQGPVRWGLTYDDYIGEHERHMLANLATQLIVHESITTTEARAKRLRPYVEKLISKGKRGDLHARRTVMRKVTDKYAVYRLFEEIAPQLEGRDGGYTRIVKTAPRKGDNAPMAVISLVLEPVAKKEVVADAVKTAKKAAEKAVAEK